MKKLLSSLTFLVVLLLLCHAATVQAQDIHFSQFFETPLLRNPSLAGIFKGDIRAQMVYRSQWNNVTDAYRTGSFNIEYKKPIGRGDDFFTIGAQVLYDRAGTIALTSTHLLPVLNYQKSLSTERNMYLSLGFMGGLVQRTIDQSKITTNSQFDGTSYNSILSNGENFTNSSYSYFDASVGVSFNAQLGEDQNNNIFGGIAYQHLNKSRKISFYSSTDYEMAPKWVYSAGIRMNATDNSYVTFEADYSKQKIYTELIGGFMYSYKLDDPIDPNITIHGGVYVRLKDAVIPVIKLEKKPISISFSYDVNMSQLSSASQSRGGFEMSISYQKFKRTDSKYTSSEAVRCPRF